MRGDSAEVRRLQAAGRAVRAAREARLPADPVHDRKVAEYLNDGWVIAKLTPRATYLVPRGHRMPAHALHAWLSLCTAGLWLPVWLVIRVAFEAKIRRRPRR